MTEAARNLNELNDTELDDTIANILSEEGWDEADEDADEVIASEVADEDLSEIVEDIETTEQLEASYAEQGEIAAAEAAATAAPQTDDEIEEVTTKKAKRVSVKGLKPSEIVRAKCAGYESLGLVEGDTIDIEAFVNSFDDMAKKVGEKAVNLMQFICGKDSLSVYTQEAIRFLADKKEATLKEMIAHFEGGLRRPYSHGTASAQSSQMMALLPAFKIATRNGSTLTLNEDSLILPFVAASA